MATPDILRTTLLPYWMNGIGPDQYAEVGGSIVDIAFRYRHIRSAYKLQTATTTDGRHVYWARQQEADYGSFALHQFNPDFYTLAAEYESEQNPRTFVFIFGAQRVLSEGLKRVILSGQEDVSAQAILNTSKRQGKVRKDETGMVRREPSRTDQWTFSKALLGIRHKPEKT